MSYRNRLQPWCIVRHLPNGQNQIIERFSNRSEAEAYMRTLQRLMPAAYRSLIFAAGDNFQELPQNQSPLGMTQPPLTAHKSAYE